MASTEATEQLIDQENPGGPSPARVSPPLPAHHVPEPGVLARLARKPWLWFLLPALLVYGILFVYPTIWAFKLALFDWRGGSDIGTLGSLMSVTGLWRLVSDWNGVEGAWGFVGLQNFSELLRSRRFGEAALHSGQLFLFVFIFQNTISLGMAILLNRKSRMTHVYRAIIFLPVIMSAVATGIIWILMLDPLIGAVNPFLRDIGLGSLQREWQADPRYALWTVMVVQAWHANGMGVVLYLAGLQSVPEDLQDAARVDGAGRWRVFRDVTFPLLAPAFSIVTVMTFILIFRAFDLPYVLGGSQGAPDGHTRVLGVLIYGDAFGVSGFNAQPRMSYAIAEGVTLFVFLAGVSFLLLKALGRREEAIQT
jgi:raffinose/stachyose/melibiose transport system permease protein